MESFNITAWGLEEMPHNEATATNGGSCFRAIIRGIASLGLYLYDNWDDVKQGAADARRDYRS